MSLLSQVRQDATGPRKWIGRSAKPCTKCQGIQFYVNGAGGVLCGVCNPPRDESVVRLRLSVSEGHYDEFSMDWDITLPQANSEAGLPAPRSDVNRIDPPQSINPVYVSAKLEIFIGDPETCRVNHAGREYEIPFYAEKQNGSETVYRLLDQDLFACLVASVESSRQKMSTEEYLQARQSLCDIAGAAVCSEVFGEWANEPENWPRAPRAGYRPPADNYRWVDLERYVFQFNPTEEEKQDGNGHGSENE